MARGERWPGAILLSFRALREKEGTLTSHVENQNPYGLTARGLPPFATNAKDEAPGPPSRKERGKGWDRANG